MNRMTSELKRIPWLLPVRVIAVLAAVLLLAGMRANGDEVEATHWAFRPLTRITPPDIVDTSRARTAVDAFLSDKLRERSLSFSVDADRVTLLRRTYLDLIGLPPDPEDVDAFLADPSLDADDRMVDRLLASPAFGERWARHWLDVVGYMDTTGFDQDANLILVPEGKWKYRHYVINAFNKGKPYDRFVREQLAGDELLDWRNADHYTDEMRESLIATGFLRTAADFTHEPESFIKLNMFEVLHDTIEIVNTSLLGITMHCSRCHDHKFDPLTQKDYYRLMSCFTPAYNPDDWRAVYPWKPEIVQRGMPDVSIAEQAAIEKHNMNIDTRIAAIEEERKSINERARKAVIEKKHGEKYLEGKDKSTARMQVSDDELVAALSEADKASLGRLQNEIAQLNVQRKTWGRIQALFDVGSPPATRLLEGGSYLSPGNVVEPGFIHMLSRTDRDYFSGTASEESSGRRTALANWITDPDGPAGALLARVMMNRMWQHVFGEGLVPTSENLGVNGAEPTHPELLEWLSGEFVRTGWDVKQMLRTLVTSTAYRQASTGEAAPDHPDPTNRLLWRMRMRRLDAEVIRDSVLAATNRLDRAMGGEPVYVKANTDGSVTVDPSKLDSPSAGGRRSVYLLHRRNYNLSMLSTFDQPLIATTCSRRNPAAVVSQSLMMLNDKFLFDQSQALAERVVEMAGESADSRIKTAFRLVLARQPNENELELCKTAFEQQKKKYSEDAERQALTHLCHTLFNTSEFLYAE